MKRIHIYVLAALTLAGALLVLLTDGDRDRSESVQAVLFPELEAQLERVARVEIRNADATVTISRQGRTWLVQEKNGYPANIAHLRRLLISLAKLQLFEKKTAKPEHFARLGLQAIDQKGSRTKQVRVWDDANELLAGVLVGDEGVNGGSYVREIDKDQTWLASAAVRVELKIPEWLDRQLLDVPAERIQAIHVTPATGDPYSLKRLESGDFALEGGGEALDKAAVARLTGAFSSLEFDDVVAESNVEIKDSAWSNIEIDLTDGTKLELRIVGHHNKYYLSLHMVAGDGGGGNAMANSAYWSGRYFVIPQHKANIMLTGRKSLLSATPASDGQSGG